MQDVRQKIVTKIFPQLVYLCANIVIYIDKAALHDTTYVKRVEDFALRSTATEGSGEKPTLIIVQNFANPSQQADLSAYEIDKSSNDFCEANRESSVVEIINSYYQGGVTVAKLPEYDSNPLLYETQLNRIKVSRTTFILLIYD